jgi:hypothetical protein
MRRLFALLATLSCVAVAANAPIREVTSLAAIVPGMDVPAFFKGYVYWAGREPLQVYAPDGQPVYVPRPNGTAEAFAADTDGTLAIAWTSETGGGINVHEPSGALLRTIPTGRYRPTHLTFAEDHSLWSLGWQTSASNSYMPDRSDYMMVRRFLPNGQPASAVLARSQFPKGLEPGGQSWQRSNCITASHSAIGLWVTSGGTGNNTEWVELDLNGNLTGRWRLDKFSYELRVAFTSDGHVFVHHADLDTNTHNVTYSLLTLDRASSTWKPFQSAPTGNLASADGDALIFADNAAGPMHLRWYQHP